MQTSLASFIINTPEGMEADSILRACVHCGFCSATCPTYQLLGDELDGPRGRIYLIKQVLEGHPPGHDTQRHLDRCLVCRACETTCPSGVRYSRLLEIGRQQVDRQVSRGMLSRVIRKLLCTIVPYPKRFTPLLRIGQFFRPLLPKTLKDMIPRSKPVTTRANMPDKQTHQRSMILHQGCVQNAMAPDINTATINVLDRLGIQAMITRAEGCCGAVSQHTGEPHRVIDFMRRNIDAWWPMIESGAEAIVSNASGCGLMIKEYAGLLRNDPDYKDKAGRVSELAKDIGEIIQAEGPGAVQGHQEISKVAFHSPCSLQHGQRLSGVVEDILMQSGFHMAEITDTHLCCGSAGTYSLLQPVLATQMRNNKVAALQADHPQVIVTANIGCLSHLQAGSEVPVIHWIQLLDQTTSL